MADALGQCPLTVESFGKTHFVGTAFQLAEDVTYRGDTSHPVCLHSFLQLAQTEFHVVEVGDCLTQRLFQVYQHLLEVAEGLATAECILRVHLFLGAGIRDEDAHAPVSSVAVLVIGLASRSLYEAQALAVDVLLALCLQLMAYMCCHRLNVVLQQVYIGENGVIDALQDVVGSVSPHSGHMQRFVDQSVSYRTDAFDSSFDAEL